MNHNCEPDNSQAIKLRLKNNHSVLSFKRTPLICYLDTAVSLNVVVSTPLRGRDAANLTGLSISPIYSELNPHGRDDQELVTPINATRRPISAPPSFAKR